MMKTAKAVLRIVDEITFMTADQSLKLFEIVNRHFKNDEDSKAFVTEIDKLVSERTKEEARFSATKDDLPIAKLNLIKWMFGFW